MGKFKSLDMKNTTPILYINVSEDPTFKAFISKKERKPRTIKNNISKLKMYCKYLQMTPTEIIQEAEEDEDDRVRMKYRRICNHWMNFIGYLKDGKRSPGYITNIMSIIKSFYRGNGIEIPKDIQTVFKDPNPDEIITDEDLPSRDDMKKALTYANKKYQAIILLMSSSGMGASEVASLTVGKYLESLEIEPSADFNINEVIKTLDNTNDVAIWHIKRIKSDKPYITFSSPESCKAINEYLKKRNISKLDNKGNETNKDIIKSVDDPLFLSRNNGVTPSGLSEYFNVINKRCGFGYVDEHERTCFFHSHGLRKFFITTLANSDIIDPLTALWLTGHKVESISDTYIKQNINKLKAKYIEILPELAVREMESYEVEKLKQNLKDHESEDKQRIKQLEEELASVKNDLGDLSGLREILKNPKVKEAMEEVSRAQIDDDQ